MISYIFKLKKDYLRGELAIANTGRPYFASFLWVPLILKPENKHTKLENNKANWSCLSLKDEYINAYKTNNFSLPQTEKKNRKRFTLYLKYEIEREKKARAKLDLIKNNSL